MIKKQSVPKLEKTNKKLALPVIYFTIVRHRRFTQFDTGDIESEKYLRRIFEGVSMNWKSLMFTSSR